MIKTTEFSHVAVRVTDVEKSKNFYEQVIGLKTIPRPQIKIPGEWYGVGNNQLHIIGGEPRTGIDPTGPHMAIEVEDFDATKAKVEELGIPYLDGAAMVSRMTPEAQKMVGRQLWIQDPDGNVIELRQSSR
ncbi:MAG TPA: VOC family protein [Candidatus Binataceae bacterium]|nr:VOC family protein [Candidatus Binataceae bacterium]